MGVDGRASWERWSEVDEFFGAEEVERMLMIIRKDRLNIDDVRLKCYS